MPEKQIDCIRVGKVKARKKEDCTGTEAAVSTMIKKIAVTVVDFVGTLLAIVGAGCFAGIGFGVGLAIMFVLI